MNEKRFRAPGPGQNGQDMGHTRQTNAQADARVCLLRRVRQNAGHNDAYAGLQFPVYEEEF